MGGALLEKAHHGVAELEVLRRGHDLLPPPRAWERHGEDLPTVAAGPLVIITMRSAKRSASSTSWVTMMTVFRSASHSVMS